MRLRMVPRWLKWAFVCLAGSSVAGCGGGQATRPPTKIVPDVSLVIRNGELVHTLFRPAVNDDPQLNAYVKAICGRLTSAARDSDQYGGRTLPIECDIVPGDACFAFTTGGIHAYVSSGLVQLCSNENELAAVLAHELAHLLTGQSAARGIIDSSDAKIVAYRLATVPFSAAEEREADLAGFEIYARAGWEPAEYGNVFSRAGTPGGDFGPPESRQVAGRLPRSAEEWRQPPVADARTFVRLRRRSQAFSSSPDNNARLILRCFQVCFGSDRGADRQAALKELEKIIAPPPPPIENTDHHSGGKG